MTGQPITSGTKDDFTITCRVPSPRRCTPLEIFGEAFLFCLFICWLYMYNVMFVLEIVKIAFSVLIS
jgi:hypothetical protein